tara:strand:- start:749 stop:1693 length:945 start_codon:yes stop_codon:yes gene_type:complete
MRKRFILSVVLGGSALLLGCQDPQASSQNHSEANELTEALIELERRAYEDMIFIKGGTFTMGDFGAVSEAGTWLPYFPPTAEQNKAHEVTLSDYSLSRQKTTWEDFDTYLVVNDLDVFERNFSDVWEREPYNQDASSRFFIDKPAKVTWQEAKDYCQWLGEETGLPLDLPTSAQWEFAGRNRGSKEWLYSTHDGKSLASNRELEELVYEGSDFVPVGSRLPANPLGLYDMADNGKEWVNDWFSPTYYAEHPTITDPQGPAEGRKKMVRNLDFSFSHVGMSASLPSNFNEEWNVIAEYTFRCAVQSDTPVGKVPE